MTGFVVDASIVVKWLVTESHSELAVRLLSENQTLAAPDLLYVEVANALWAKARRGEITPDDIRDAIDTLTDAPIVVPAGLKELIAAAARLATDLAHPVYDCVYLALAMQEQRPVITADRRFYDAVHKHPYLSDRIVHLENLA